MKVSYYRTNPDLLAKTFCVLAEKCYYSDMKTLVVTTSDEYMRNLDQVLWSYSKKHFIPHATSGDAYPEIQPVLISTKIEPINNPEILFTVNSDSQTIKSCFDKQIGNIKKLIILEDEIAGGHTLEKIDQLVNQHNQQWQQFEKFQQSEKGAWQKL